MSLTIKNYKQLEGWAHNYKDLRVGAIYETSLLYSFNVAYNSTPYTIKIFRNGTTNKEYEMVLSDGLDMTIFGRMWVMKNSIAIDNITNTFEKLIVHHKPKAKQINNPFYSNGPF